MFILDTNVAIMLRDGDPEVIQKLAALGEDFYISVVTQVELVAGASNGSREDVAARRARLNALFNTVSVIAFDQTDAETYGDILAVRGFSRRKVLDRMIAAQALLRGATLITYNAADFRDVPGLQLLEL